MAVPNNDGGGGGGDDEDDRSIALDIAQHPEAILEAASYREQYDRGFIQPRPDQSDAVRVSLFKPFLRQRPPSPQTTSSNSSGGNCGTARAGVSGPVSGGELGLLGVLPLELLTQILLLLDIASVFSFSHTSNQARCATASIREYRLLAAHAPDALWAVLRTRVAPHMPVQQLFSAMRTTRCAFCPSSQRGERGRTKADEQHENFGALLFLPTAERACLRCCFAQEGRAEVALGRLARELGGFDRLRVPDDDGSRPFFRTIPSLWGPVTQRVYMTDNDEYDRDDSNDISNKNDANSGKGEYDDQVRARGSGQVRNQAGGGGGGRAASGGGHCIRVVEVGQLDSVTSCGGRTAPWRKTRSAAFVFLSLTGFPYVAGPRDFAGDECRVEVGVSCRGCRIPIEENRVRVMRAGALSFGCRRLELSPVFSRDGFLKHFAACDEAVALWRAKRRGGRGATLEGEGVV